MSSDLQPEYLLSVRHFVFPNGRLEDEYFLNFDDREAAIDAYENTVQGELITRIILLDCDSGQIIRKFTKGGKCV